MLLNDILVHADTREAFDVNWKDRQIFLNEEDRYNAGFERGVPYFLPAQNQNLKSSKIRLY